MDDSDPGIKSAITAVLIAGLILIFLTILFCFMFCPPASCRMCSRKKKSTSRANRPPHCLSRPFHMDNHIGTSQANIYISNASSHAYLSHENHGVSTQDERIFVPESESGDAQQQQQGGQTPLYLSCNNYPLHSRAIWFSSTNHDYVNCDLRCPVVGEEGQFQSNDSPPPYPGLPGYITFANVPTLGLQSSTNRNNCEPPPPPY